MTDCGQSSGSSWRRDSHPRGGSWADGCSDCRILSSDARPARMRVVEAGNLRLEPQTAQHAAEMFAVLSDPAIYEYENEPPASAEWLRERFSRLETRMSRDGREQWLNWVIRIPSSELIGYVQATVHSGGRANIAYVLSSAYWGRGHGAPGDRGHDRRIGRPLRRSRYFRRAQSEKYAFRAFARATGFCAGSAGTTRRTTGPIGRVAVCSHWPSFVDPCDAQTPKLSPRCPGQAEHAQLRAQRAVALDAGQASRRRCRRRRVAPSL